MVARFRGWCRERRRRRSEMDPARRSGVVKRNVWIAGRLGFLGAGRSPGSSTAVTRSGRWSPPRARRGKLPAAARRSPATASRRGDLRRRRCDPRGASHVQLVGRAEAEPGGGGAVEGRRPGFGAGVGGDGGCGRGWPSFVCVEQPQPTPAMGASWRCAARRARR